ncbi:MAG: hypothetical protein LW884_07705 [Bacteroidetes bacterium]|jgi:regulatory protein YycH of two-component signal transduction system YycFG|nr:hypothetical protein [Bacteroidota bacterium]
MSLPTHIAEMLARLEQRIAALQLQLRQLQQENESLKENANNRTFALIPQGFDTPEALAAWLDDMIQEVDRRMQDLQAGAP